MRHLNHVIRIIPVIALWLVASAAPAHAGPAPSDPEPTETEPAPPEATPAASEPATAAPADTGPRWTLQLDPLTTALGFVHLQVEYAIAPPVSFYFGPSLHLFPGILAPAGEAPYTGIGVELGVRWFFYGAAPEGGWLMLRGVVAHLGRDDGSAENVGGYVSLLAGYTWIYDDWFVLSGGLGVQYLAYEVGGSGISGVLPAAHTTLGVAF